MLDDTQKQVVLSALDDKVASYNRSAAKQPQFKVVTDKLIAEIREIQVAIRAQPNKK